APAAVLPFYEGEARPASLAEGATRAPLIAASPINCSPYRLPKEVFMKEVVIYSLSTCPWCKKAKRYFDERNVTYDNTDYDLVDTDEQARVEKDMRDLKTGGFPVVKIGRDVV